MDPLDRYVRAVEAWLPREQRADIVAELAEDLRSEVEEQEKGRGRPLDEAEMNALLARRGHPMWLAESYLPTQSLIGPVLLPIYRQVLKVVLPLIAALFALSYVAFTLIAPGTGPTRVGAGTWAFVFVVYAFALLGLITVIFAIIDRRQASERAAGRWDPAHPDNLPFISLNPGARSRLDVRVTAASDLVTAAVTGIWWAGVLHLPRIPGIVPAPIWHQLHVPVLVFFAAWALVALWVGWAGSWTRGRAAARLLTEVFGLGLIAAIVFSGRPVAIDAGGHPLSALAPLINVIVVWIVLVPVAAWLAARGVQDGLRAAGRPPITNWCFTALTGN